MKNTQGDERVVLITGASTGIGLALAKTLVPTAYRLVLTARASSLHRFEKEGVNPSDRVWLRPLDVTKPQEGDAVVAEVQEKWGGVDVLINNAGVAYRAVIEHLEDRDEEDQFHINYLGALHLIRLVLPHMRAKRRGRIINLSSVDGMMAMPTMGGYSASKFALEGASEALWYELKPWGIHVSLIEPGFVHSNSFQNALFTSASRKSYSDPGDAYHRYYSHLIRFIEKMMHLTPTTPERIAKRIAFVITRRNPPLRVSATWDAVFFLLLRRLLPQRFYHWFLYRTLPGIGGWVEKQEK